MSIYSCKWIDKCHCTQLDKSSCVMGNQSCCVRDSSPDHLHNEHNHHHSGKRFSNDHHHHHHQYINQTFPREDTSFNFLPHISERELPDGLYSTTIRVWLFITDADNDPSTHPSVKPTFMERSRSEMKCLFELLWLDSSCFIQWKIIVARSMSSINNLVVLHHCANQTHVQLYFLTIQL
jgi:hypothetical protein